MSHIAQHKDADIWIVIPVPLNGMFVVNAATAPTPEDVDVRDFMIHERDELNSSDGSKCLRMNPSIVCELGVSSE